MGLCLVAAVLVALGGLAIAGFVDATVTKGVVAYSGGMNLIAGWLSFVPVVVVRRLRKDYLPQAVLAATTVRLFVVALATFVAMSMDWYAMWALSVWMIAFYLAILAVETGFAIWYARGSRPVGCAG